MSRLIMFSIVLMFSMTFPVGCLKAQTSTKNDLSTDEAVIAELQERQDTKNAELAKDNDALRRKMQAANKLGQDDVCIRRLKESPKVIVIGFFRFDYGCHFEGAFVDSLFYEADALEIHEHALAALGWQKADETERERIAKLWVEKGWLAFFDVLETKPKELEKFDFHAPRVETTDTGKVKVTVWVRLPSGRTREKGFQRFAFEFNADGTFSGGSTLENVTAANLRRSFSSISDI